jgi:hypothetical protein
MQPVPPAFFLAQNALGLQLRELYGFDALENQRFHLVAVYSVRHAPLRMKKRP